MQFRITFQECGQDFLEWTIDTVKEKIINCEPFQYTLWVGLTCQQKAFEVGGKVKFINNEGDLVELKYPIEKIEININKNTLT